jgi:hypothetical protein
MNGERIKSAKRNSKPIILTLFVTCLIFFSANASPQKEPENIPDYFPQIPSFEIVKKLVPVLEKGSVVIIQREKGKPPFITGIVLINASLEKVFSVVRELEKYHEFVPNVSKVRVVEKVDENTENVEYNLAFDVALGIKFKISYTLEEKNDYKNYIRYGVPAKKGEQAFRDVRFIEKFFSLEDGRTVMIYSAYADLASFGLLSKLVFRAFPELQIPALVAVSTLFPEAVKERIEKRKIIVEPKEVNYNLLKAPERLDINSLLPILRLYRNIIISWYPDESGVRFFSSFVLLKRDIDYIKSQITNFSEWPKVFKIVEEANPETIRNGYRVKFKVKYKVVFPIELEYSSIYLWDEKGERLTCQIDRTQKRDIEGSICSWDFYNTNYGTVIGYSEFSDLRTGSYFLKLLMDKVPGFGIGLRVALVSAYSELMKEKL